MKKTLKAIPVALAALLAAGTLPAVAVAADEYEINVEKELEASEEEAEEAESEDSSETTENAEDAEDEEDTEKSEEEETEDIEDKDTEDKDAEDQESEDAQTATDGLSDDKKDDEKEEQEKDKETKESKEETEEEEHETYSLDIYLYKELGARTEDMPKPMAEQIGAIKTYVEGNTVDYTDMKVNGASLEDLDIELPEEITEDTTIYIYYDVDGNVVRDRIEG